MSGKAVRAERVGVTAGVFTLAVAGVAGLLLSTSVPALAPGAALVQSNEHPAQQTAAMRVRESTLPPILSQADAVVYREVFRLKREGKRKAMATKLKEVQDRSLVPYVRSPQPRLGDLGEYRATRAEKRALTKLPKGQKPKPEQRFSRRNAEPVSGPAARLFFNGNDIKAFTLAKAEARSAKPTAHWTAGLAAWRLGKTDAAVRHFEALASARRANDWMRAAGAYWAARAHLVGGRPEQVNRYLDIAAQYPRTFYGLLALRSLGLTPTLNWEIPFPDAEKLEILRSLPAGRRALALLQIGETEQAEKELRLISRHADRDLTEVILAVTDQAGLSDLLYKMGNRLRDVHGRPFDSALYPVPPWQPGSGYEVDRALIFGIMRQESQFDPEALSPAGARGLMQLMPPTASFIARDKSLRFGRVSRLYDPKFNLSLGQDYLEHLLEQKDIKRNLFLLAAAYNGGIGNVQRWRQQIRQSDDPLMFIESIPFRETRGYVEKVLTNFWMYRLRLGQPTPSLDALAAGQWPVYSPLDSGSPQPESTALRAAVDW